MVDSNIYNNIVTGENLKLGRSSGLYEWVGLGGGSEEWGERRSESRAWWRRIDFSVVSRCGTTVHGTRYSGEKLEKGGTSTLKRGRRRVVRLNHFGESRVALLFALRAIFFQIPVTLVKGL